ncbi:MAG: alginate export family protein [Sphingomonas phyllosphaerae]
MPTIADPRRMVGRGSLFCALMLTPAGAAWAQETSVTPIANVRLRFEAISQDGIPRNADALTVRARPGVIVKRDAVSAVVEGEATIALDRRFNDGFNGRSNLPLIPDADNFELNRLALRYDGAYGSITAGRQLIELADQRFVGSSSFRQNQQTFDSVRLQAKPTPRLSVDVTYAWSVRTPMGRKGHGARPESIPGDNVFALLGYATPIGALTGFVYLIDQDDPAVQGYRLQNRNLGARLVGTRELSPELRLSYVASYAWQSNHHRNPNRYNANYYVGEVSLTRRALTGKVGYEVRGADDGRDFTSFQTPEGSALRFQGWAGRFAVTPPDGVRDLYAGISPSWNTHGIFEKVGIDLTGHRFESDRLIRHYGSELDLVASARIGAIAVMAGYADYRADRFATDFRRGWLSVEWSL